MDAVVQFTEDEFLHTTKPYDYLVSIESATVRDSEITTYKKFALKNCGISAVTFKAELRKAEARLLADDPDARVDEWMTFTDQPVDLRCPGYVCNDTGIWTEGSGMSGPVCICQQPVLPSRRIANYDTGEQKVEVSYREGKDWKSIIVPRTTLASATKIFLPLSERGIAVDSENAREMVKYFTRILNSNLDKLPLSHSATRMGWVGSHFLPFEQNLLFDGELEFRQLYDSIREHGSYEAWLDLVGDVRRGRSIAARAMLAASFASVLIKPLQILPFMVHCWSSVSGTGKTVALMLAASVWADPNDGAYVKNMNTTNVGLEAVSGFLGSLPVCLDELCMKDKKGYKGDLEDMVYQFCEGVGRARGSRNGGVQQQRMWNCCAITTGETPLIKSSSRAGAVNRVLELDNGEAPLFPDSVRAASIVRNNYGFAGRRFVTALQQDGALDTVQGYYKDYHGQLVDLGATGKQSMAIAAVLAADKFAALKLFDDTYNLRVSDFAHLLKSSYDVDTNLRAYDWLLGTIAENNHMFEPTDEHHNGGVWGKLDEDGDETTACIISSRFTALMESAGYDERAFRQWASARGLIDGYSGKSSKPVRIPGISKAVRCICIKIRTPDELVPDENAPVQVEVPDQKQENLLELSQKVDDVKEVVPW